MRVMDRLHASRDFVGNLGTAGALWNKWLGRQRRSFRNSLLAGAIQRLIITRVPVLIGEGGPLFGSLPHDIRLRHVATRHSPSGLIKSEYYVDG